MKNWEEFLAENPLFRKAIEQPWDAERTIGAMENLKRLHRLGFLTDKEADLMARTVRSIYRKGLGLPHIEGDPKYNEL